MMMIIIIIFLSDEITEVLRSYVLDQDHVITHIKNQSLILTLSPVLF